MKINLPEKVRYILDFLHNNNFEGFIVGGCVRDSLLGKVPKDWDITTNAAPQEIIDIFDHTVPTGIQHGTVTVVLDRENYELTTYRIEGKYTDNRHPDEVSFTNKLSEDLSRRDFTVNAMAYNDYVGLVDIFDGLSHLQSRLIQAVGNANNRFTEDSLRMMRAIRFSSQLDFTIQEDTLKAIANNSRLIANISNERIRDELSKILTSSFPSEGIRKLTETGLLPYILPELQKCVGFKQYNVHHDKDVFEHTLSVVENTPNSLIVRLAALFHDIAKPLCFSMDEKGQGHFYRHNIIGEEVTDIILKRLRFDNDTIRKVTILVREHMSGYDISKSSSIKKFINRVGVENLEDLFSLQLADKKAHKDSQDLEPILHLKQEVHRILEEKQPLTIKDMPIDGNDLIDIGFKSGKELGVTLKYLNELVLENPTLNSKEKLLEFAKKRLQEN